MEFETPHSALRARILRIPPVVVFGLSLVVTVVATILSVSTVLRARHLEFQTDVASLESAFRYRMLTYVKALQQTTGLFRASQDVTGTEFRAYFDSVDLQRNFPGARALGWAPRVTPRTLVDWKERMAREHPGLRGEEWDVTPLGMFGDSDVFPMTYYEPKDIVDARVFGLDQTFDITRRQAAEAARDAGAPRMSGRLTPAFRRLGGEIPYGLILYAPVYEGEVIPVDVPARRERLRGFVVLTFLVKDLFPRILEQGSDEPDDPDIHRAAGNVGFEIHDGSSLSGTSLMYRSLGGEAAVVERARFQAEGTLDIAGRPWRIRFFSRPEFDARVRERLQGVPPLVASGGILLSVLIFGILRAWQKEAALEALQRAEREAASRELAAALAREHEALREAERQGRVKDEFLATLSHELRTPLTAITGWSDLLNRGLVKGPDIPKAVAAVERNARAQLKLVNDLLDISRITTGKLVLETADVDMDAVVQAALESVRLSAEVKGIVLETTREVSADAALSSAEKCLLLVQGDAARLQQALWNLLTNAIKFTPAGGKVTVRVAHTASHVDVSVVDTGEGIENSFLPKLFERFTQSDTGTTRRHGGLGLGLAIVRQVVELHGGTVWAKSDGEGKGATLGFRLPVHRAKV